MFELDSISQAIMEKIEESGFEVFLVGGVVRDRIMGNISDDIDITTSATPIEIKEIFSEYNVIETGIKHGTVTVIYENTPVEITTYRKDISYTDNRHPDEVEFCSSLEEDLKRRDFTVNALCVDKCGNLTDMFGGLSDIKNKVIKAIGDPVERFNEDALRILRALRFSAVLGFTIDSDTSDAIHKCKNLIEHVANERVAVEIRKMLLGNNIKNVLLNYADVFTLILPELSECVGFEQHNFHHKYTVYEHIATVVENAPRKDYMRLAALFHDCAKPRCFSSDENGIGHFYTHASISSNEAVNALRRLRFDNATIDRVSLLVKQHDAFIDEDERILMRKLNRFGEDALRDLIALQKADTLGLADEFHDRLSHFDNLNNMIDRIIEDSKCFSVKDLEINGNDIKKLGFSGKEIGEKLSFLVEAVIDSKVINKKDQLIKYLMQNP